MPSGVSHHTANGRSMPVVCADATEPLGHSRIFKVRYVSGGNGVIRDNFRQGPCTATSSGRILGHSRVNVVDRKVGVVRFLAFSLVRMIGHHPDHPGWAAE